MLESQVGLWLALGAGLLSFFTPCVLPMIPVYLLYMTGTAAGGASLAKRWSALTHAAFFVGGFSLLFVTGGVTVGFLGGLMPRVMSYVVKIGAVVLILFGLQMTGLLRLPFLSTEKRAGLQNVPAPGYWRSFVVGLVFAAGWTPCVGPVLASIFALAASSQTAVSGAILLGTYSIGLGVPFLAVAALSDMVLPTLRGLSRYGRVFSIVGGLFLMAMGLLLVTGRWELMVSRLNSLTGAR